MTLPELSRATAVFHFVEERAGLSLQSLGGERGEYGVRAAMTRAGFDDPGSYVEHLRRHAPAFDDLIAELTVPETYFFRDPSHFEFVRSALPALSLTRPSNHVFRAWSAGCASGEEAYSLAITFEEQGLAESSMVFATDISQRVLERAKRALYSPWALRGVEPERVARYFQKVDATSYRLASRFLPRVLFSLHNLTKAGYPISFSAAPSFDFVLCRNVLIYLRPEAARCVAASLVRSLGEGGWLLTGPSDPPLDIGADCETLCTNAGVFYRKHAFAARPSRAPLKPSLAKVESLRSERVVVKKVDDDAERKPQSAASPAAEYDARLRAEAVLAASVLTEVQVRDVRRASNEQGSTLAEALCRRALTLYPLSPALHYMHASLLLDLRQIEAAEAAVRRVLYLDETLAAAHFLSATIARQRGDLAAARRAYLQASKLCAGLPEAELVGLGEGLSNGMLAASAAREAQALVTHGGSL